MSSQEKRLGKAAALNATKENERTNVRMHKTSKRRITKPLVLV